MCQAALGLDMPGQAEVGDVWLAPLVKQDVWAWFKNARFRVTLGISARTLIGPALERVYATPG